ncbi:hypothetical protein K466DRAFT_606774 [Polyporus arcularius HHB13444]|uniref:Uncharacterized protein n=1 Tax=Polyporus arcularius HHB13444 TaxID=1314778 RepID=A0A5C3NLR3_9APHY|nr:hypothetical protein K466DRAFT_606774 [Polyporus arcularius HHB13444]
MDPIVLKRKQYEVFDSLFNAAGQPHMKITHVELIKAMEAAGFKFRWDKRGRFDPPANMNGGSVYIFNVTHDKLGNHIDAARQDEIKRLLHEKYGWTLGSFELTGDAVIAPGPRVFVL